jgi:hypothetical protein
MCLGDYSFDSSAIATYVSFVVIRPSFLPSLSANRCDICYSLPVGHYPVPGTLYNANTKEDFGRFDKTKLMQSAGAQIWKDIQSGDALRVIILCVLDVLDLNHVISWCHGWVDDIESNIVITICIINIC